VTERRGLVNYRVKFNASEEKTFHINTLKEYNKRKESKKMTVNELPEREKEIVGEEQPNNEVDQEEPVIGVVEDSEDEEDKSEIMRNRKTETVAAMEVVVDSDSEEEEVQCQEKIGNSDVGIYCTEQKETWRDVNINPELSPEQSRQVWNLVEEYKKIFSDVPTTTHILKHDIKLTSQEPVYSKPSKLPYNLVEPVEKKIRELEQRGWIEPSNAAYASSIRMLY